MLSVSLGLFNLCVNQLLPSNMLRVGHKNILLDSRDVAQHWVELARSETLSPNVNWHGHRDLGLLRWVLLLRCSMACLLLCILVFNRLLLLGL